MSLQCLIVTQDSSLLSVVRTVFSGKGIELEMRREATSAMDVATGRHLDCFVVDCDDVPGAGEVLTKIRACRSNKMTTIFAVVNGTTSMTDAGTLGANYVLRKPVEEKRLKEYLDLAVDRIEREHRRYFRYPVQLPVRLQVYEGEQIAGEMINVSEGGMAVRISGSVQLDGTVGVEFDLPSTEVRSFSAKAMVAWASKAAIGLRFLYVTPPSQAAFKAWMDALESQAQFREALKEWRSQEGHS